MNYYVPKALQEKYERDAIIRFVIDFLKNDHIWSMVESIDMLKLTWSICVCVLQQNEIASFPGRPDVPIQHHGHCATGGDENYESGGGRGSAWFESTGAHEITQGFQNSLATLPTSPRIARNQQGI